MSDNYLHAPSTRNDYTTLEYYERLIISLIIPYAPYRAGIYFAHRRGKSKSKELLQMTLSHYPNIGDIP